MVLIPFPKKLTKKDGFFYITNTTEILLDVSCDYADFEAAIVLQDEIEKITGMKTTVAKGTYEVRRSASVSKKGITGVENHFIYLVKTPDIPKILTNSKGLASRRTSDDPIAQTNLQGTPSNSDADKSILQPSYKLDVQESLIKIKGNGSNGLFYGIQTLRQLVRNGFSTIPCVEIEDYPDFENRGFYHDITRGKVPTLETLKELADRLSFYKINQLQLYVEHSFAFRKHSEIWVDSDPITAEEILILDEYCAKKNIELVPSISTFGHLYHALVSESFKHLNEFEEIPEKPFLWTERMSHYTLDSCNPMSLQFVKEMIDEYLPLFTSNKFNICCDETFDLGRGRNKALADEVGKGKLYLYFVKNIIEHVKTHKKTVMMWGDILLNHPEVLKEVPEDVILLNWDYSPNAQEDRVRLIAEAGLAQYTCPGVQGWNKLINNMDDANKNIAAMVAYAKKYNAQGILNTDWGDFGHINLLSNSIPSAIYGAGLSWNTEDMTKPTDEEISKLEYGDKSGRIVTVFRELSRQSILEWDTAVLWYYSTIGMNMDSYGYSGHHLKRMLESDENQIKSSYNKIRELEKELSALNTSIFEDRKQDLREFLVSADGLALFQALLLVIKKKFLGQKDTCLLFNPQELAEKLEYWFVGYKKAWRSRNKESELFRIKEVIMGICRLLRG